MSDPLTTYGEVRAVTTTQRPQGQHGKKGGRTHTMALPLLLLASACIGAAAATGDTDPVPAAARVFVKDGRVVGGVNDGAWVGLHTSELSANVVWNARCVRRSAALACAAGLGPCTGHTRPGRSPEQRAPCRRRPSRRRRMAPTCIRARHG